MAIHSYSHRIARALAVALAGLAVVVPASIARPLSDGVQGWPHTAESRALSPSELQQGNGARPATATAPRLDLRNPDARALATARAQERYYSSYGEAQPLSPVPSQHTPWLPIALSITAALAIVAASATQLHRIRLRRRRAVRSMA